MVEIKEYSRDDFLLSTEPYEFVYKFMDDTFMLERVLSQVSDKAKKVKVMNFKTLFNAYVKKQQQISKTVYLDSVTQFEGQELELNVGEWRADECGVSIMTKAFGEMYACNHPILPVLRLVNIDTGVEKLKLAYRKGRQWRHVIADKKTLASNNSILELANVGVAVTSENARYLVRYLYDVESLNYDVIPEKTASAVWDGLTEKGFRPM